ncbi:hypothetical protein F4808DRAFT_462966 [Astrocystis sublimbata]|nr:hypothetical protein F4808DRAFT_462966 [Astrocystis sublimbata]
MSTKITDTEAISKTKDSSPLSPTLVAEPPKPTGLLRNYHRLSRTATIGIIIGVIFAFVLGSIFAFFYIRRLSGARRAEKANHEPTVTKRAADYIDKPELEGSRAYHSTTKPELDAAAVRAELEGDILGPHGDGIHQLKPELEGTNGTEKNRGAYVWKKSELEAKSRSRASMMQHNLAELEAVTPNELSRNESMKIPNVEETE